MFRRGCAEEKVTDPSPVLARILDGNLCSGCGLCAAVSNGAIKMQMTPAGFLRPRQNASLTPEADRLIAEVCPGISLSQTSTQGSMHTLWGPIVAARTGAA